MQGLLFFSAKLYLFVFTFQIMGKIKVFWFVFYQFNYIFIFYLCKNPSPIKAKDFVINNQMSLVF